ncbi:pilus assembly protein [Georgenia satyanarayanai]|uniref:TadE family type IV pilus minor pilin n=1 Tax=Georgenia satyanarayanai TaxID=860221 RepID=UPI0020413320|nr:TadE family type IV pilus minor pilin [Georgenia satyanarayanai]MCM3662548.1 pilus assembly protein [Georgenia satyanarayanai]
MDGGAGRRRARPGDERGAVTAELALVLPAVVMVLLVCCTLGAAVLGQVRCADAARAAARAAAIGEPAAVVTSVARELAGADAAVSVDIDGSWVEVVVSRPVASGVLGAGTLEARASARAWVEPGP